MRRDILTLAVYITDEPDSDMEPPPGYETGMDVMALDIRMNGETLTERIQAFLIAQQGMGDSAKQLTAAVEDARRTALDSVRGALVDFLGSVLVENKRDLDTGIPELPTADKPAVPLND